MEQNCQSRHPQTTKFLEGDSKGCKGNESCKYLYRHIQLKGKTTSGSDVKLNNEGMEGTETVDAVMRNKQNSNTERKINDL